MCYSIVNIGYVSVTNLYSEYIYSYIYIYIYIYINYIKNIVFVHTIIK